MILLMLLIVLTVVRGSAAISTSSYLFEGGGGGAVLCHLTLNIIMTQKSLPVPGHTFALRGIGDF